jgi:hypothetical protein
MRHILLILLLLTSAASGKAHCTTIGNTADLNRFLMTGHRPATVRGTCLEFGHTGLGKSGTFQRWGSVVLVPRNGAVAHRFVGYWASCGALTEGGNPVEIVLPTIEPVTLGGDELRILWHHCISNDCTATSDYRSVHRDAGSDSGALSFDTRPKGIK